MFDFSINSFFIFIKKKVRNWKMKLKCSYIIWENVIVTFFKIITWLMIVVCTYVVHTYIILKFRFFFKEKKTFASSYNCSGMRFHYYTLWKAFFRFFMFVQICNFILFLKLRFEYFCIILNILKKNMMFANI